MWANHDWINLQPASLEGPRPPTFDGRVSRRAFSHVVDEVVEQYFSQRNYLTVAGEPYFSIYDLGNFVDGLGGFEEAGLAIELLRACARDAGHSGVHVNAVVGGIPTLPTESGEFTPARITDLRLSSATSYVWIHHFDSAGAPFPAAPYVSALEQNHRAWPTFQDRFGLPYHPNVTVGWDSTPRTVQSDRFERRGYPWLPVLIDNTPEAFAEALERAHELVSTMPEEQRVITINAWNEWTEGSYLLPDTKGKPYLDAVGRVTARLAAGVAGDG
jgi:hypothetical protein